MRDKQVKVKVLKSVKIHVPDREEKECERDGAIFRARLG